MAEARIVIPLDEFSDNVANIMHSVLHEHRIFWVENAAGEFIEVKAAPGHRRTRRKSKADVEAFVAAAGSWSDVDSDALLYTLREQRDHSYRPPVDL